MSTQDLILLIAGGVGILMSVGFKIIPPLDKWYYNVVKDDWRGLVMVGFNLLAALAIFGFSCINFFPTVACSQEGAVELIKAFIIMVGTGQATNIVLPDSNAKREISTQKLLMRANVNPQDFQPK